MDAMVYTGGQTDDRYHCEPEPFTHGPSLRFGAAEAVDFCDQRKFPETHLWTFQGLDAARRLYEAWGFHLIEERSGQQWDKKVTEQHFIRASPKT